MYTILSSSAAAQHIFVATAVSVCISKKCVYSFTYYEKSAVLDVCSGNPVKVLLENKEYMRRKLYIKLE